MNAPQYIRQLYAPVQPTVNQSAQDVCYQEIFPDAGLQDFVYCYWQLNTQQPLQAAFSYRVVADGCIDIFFELERPHENFVMGFCKQYTEFELGNRFNYVGIRFLPTMFPQLFGINAATLSNRAEALEAVVPDMALFIAHRFHAGLRWPEIKTLLDTYLANRLAKARLNFDSRLYEALALILEKRGVVNVETALDTGISPRQLRRLFEFYIGDTAKTFCKVVRFQQILKAKPSAQSLRQNKLFFDHGYFDQAHFIKEFKHFYGVTPSRAFGR